MEGLQYKDALQEKKIQSLVSVMHWKKMLRDRSFMIIKRVINRDGATGRNNNHFERSTILNAP